MNQLMNYQNSLCDMLPPYGPATTGDLILRVTTGTLILRITIIVGVAAAIVVAGILIKRAEKKNSAIQKQNEKQQDPKI